MTKHHAELRQTRVTYWNELCNCYLNVSTHLLWRNRMGYR